jgi:hypothetical protein
MAIEDKRRRWYEEPWVTVAALIFFFPLGLFLMWRFVDWTPKVKWIVTGAVAAFFVGFTVLGALTDEEPEEPKTASSAPEEPTDVDSTEAAESSDTPPPEDTATPDASGTYSQLRITDVSVDGDNVVIAGTTDLPDGATVIVSFDVAGRADTDVYIGVDQETTIDDGQFSVTLSVPQREEFVNGPYEVSVSFTPVGQPDEVVELVGEDGENLEGDLVDDEFGFNTMRLVEQRDLQLPVAPPLYVFQQPSEFPAGSAERALAQWVLAWKNQDWPKWRDGRRRLGLTVNKVPLKRLRPSTTSDP